MKVRCYCSYLSEVKDKNVHVLSKTNWKGHDGSVSPGDEYIVYGIEFFGGNIPSYYICDEDHEDFPIATPYYFFEIIDPRLSKYWELSIYTRDNGMHISELVFKEWKEDIMFHEKLVDGEEREETIFAKYKKLMDEEYG